MEIVYDRETHDYAMYLDGELVGFARTYHDAEVTLDQLRLEQAQHAAPLSDPALEPLPAPGTSIDQQLAFYSASYKTAKLAGDSQRAVYYKKAGMELLAVKAGMEVADFLNGYAASKEVER